MSSSIQSTPNDSALLKAGIVYSGNSIELPLWAVTPLRAKLCSEGKSHANNRLNISKAGKAVFLVFFEAISARNRLSIAYFGLKLWVFV
jgi:hypothetical protein